MKKAKEISYCLALQICSHRRQHQGKLELQSSQSSRSAVPILNWPPIEVKYKIVSGGTQVFNVKIPLTA